MTAFDIMNELLYNGIIFNDDDNIRSIEKIYMNCLLQLNALVEKNIFIEYTPVQISFAIVAFNRELYGLSDKSSFFESVYNISESLYEGCLKMLRTKVKIKQKTVTA